MNIALGALILLLIVLPGISFRTSLISSDSFENPLDTSFSGELILSLLAAIPLHLCGFLVLSFCYTIDIYQLILVIVDPSSDKITSDLINSSWWKFLIYITSLTTIAYIIADCARHCILKRGLHLKYRILHITNEWDDLFQGREANIQKIKDFDVSIDLLVDTANGSVLYSGTLLKYYLAKHGGLDKLVLSGVYRRKLSDDNKTDQDDKTTNSKTPDRGIDQRWYSLPGEQFVIESSRILNIHVHFLSNVPSMESEETLEEATIK